MSFRKRNTVLSAAPSAQASPKPEARLSPGLRPSPLDGRLTTSTGTASLDGLMAGHSGLPLGTSLLVEESGTTDFSGVLLKYYAAEGLVQGHHVHVLGVSDAWRNELPALSSPARPGKSQAPAEDKMKIAWRYEALANQTGPGTAAREREADLASNFCHSFDLSRRLAASSIKGQFQACPSSRPLSLSFEPTSAPSPLMLFIKDLQAGLASAPASSVHRVVIPDLLSPTMYSSKLCHPTEILQFLHALRAILRRFSRQLTAMLSLQTTLYPRTTSLTTWMEHLCDGVLELVALPGGPSSSAGLVGAESKDAEKAQGLVHIYTLPIYHERGGGGAEGDVFRENLSFSLSSSKGLVIKPYSLPPMEDEEGKEKSPASTVKDGIEF